MCSRAEAWRASGSRRFPPARRSTRYEGLLELFPQNYHEPYYVSYINEDFGALAEDYSLTHIRDVKAFVSKVMVFDKPTG